MLAEKDFVFDMAKMASINAFTRWALQPRLLVLYGRFVVNILCYGRENKGH
jgi:hypothetical protein